jgi:cytochrome P450
MTATDIRPRIYLDDEGYHRVTDPVLARALYTDRNMTARNALRPMELLLEPARGIYAKMLASPAGEQAQRSLLAADGELHERLSAPVEAALTKMYLDPWFVAEVVTQATGLAADFARRRQPVDVAESMHRVPARIGVETLFGMAALPWDVRQWARKQTDFIWRRRRANETNEQVAAWQVDGLMAARDLQTACVETVNWHKSEAAAGRRIDDVTSDLLDARTPTGERALTDDEVMGLVYGVGIAAIEGNGFSIGNVIYEALTRGLWREIGQASDWRAAYSIVMPLLRARPGIHTTYRTAAVDFLFEDGYVIPTGATIAFDLLSIGDPFGGVQNPHRCIGASIGRVSVGVVPWVLAARFPDAELVDDGPLDLVDSRFFHGFRTLEVDFHPPA